MTSERMCLCLWHRNTGNPGLMRHTVVSSKLGRLGDERLGPVCHYRAAVSERHLCVHWWFYVTPRCGVVTTFSRRSQMSKRGRKRRSRRKNGANHGKRPNA